MNKMGTLEMPSSALRRAKLTLNNIWEYVSRIHANTSYNFACSLDREKLTSMSPENWDVELVYYNDFKN